MVTEEELAAIEAMYARLIANDVGVDMGEDYGDHSSPPASQSSRIRKPGRDRSDEFIVEL